MTWAPHPYLVVFAAAVLAACGAASPTDLRSEAARNREFPQDGVVSRHECAVETVARSIAELDGTGVRPLPGRVESLVRGRRGVILEGGQLHLWEVGIYDPPMCSLGAPPIGRMASTWIPVLARTAWRTIVFGWADACGIAGDGRALCTRDGGSHRSSELVEIGDGSVSQIELTVAPYGNNRCFVDQAGDVACRAPYSPSLQHPPSLPVISHIALGNSHMCAMAEGRVLCWGYGADGRLGDGRRTDDPRLVSALVSGARAIAAAGSTTCAIASGRVWCWGASEWGQAGPGDFECGSSSSARPNSRLPARACQHAPYEIQLPESATSVIVSLATSCALLADAELWCWGLMPSTVSPTEHRSGHRTGRVPSLDCWNAPRPVLAGVAEAAASKYGEICAVGQERARVACFGTDDPPNEVHRVREPALIFAREDHEDGGGTRTAAEP